MATEHKGQSTPKAIFIAWMLAHQRLSTMDRLASWGIQVDAVHKLCNQMNESHQLLFVECTLTQELRQGTMRMFANDMKEGSLH